MLEMAKGITACHVNPCCRETDLSSKCSRGRRFVHLTCVQSSDKCYRSLFFLISSFVFFFFICICDAQSSTLLPSSSSQQQPNNKSNNSHNQSFAPDEFEKNLGISALFSTSNVSINFTHITIDPLTDQIYVGATNWIYQLDSNLSILQAVSTGPIEDSTHCSPTDCSGVDLPLIRPTKNTNKVLVIDPTSRMLIVCGSVHQGSCRRHSLSDIRQAEPMIGVPVAANDENSSTVAFVSFASFHQQGVLYVGASNSRQGPYRDVVPAISARSLEPGPGLFSIIEKSFSDIARVDISYHMRDYFIVKYIHGFASQDFVYFATVQKKSHFRALEEMGYVTRLARVCSSDPGFHTYTEMTISCVGPDGTDYPLLQDATVRKVGSAFARSLGMDEEEEAFVGVFSQSKDHSMNPSGGSAVCVFPMSEIERGFTENIHLCFNGSVRSRAMDYIAGNIQDCPEPGKTGNIVSFCSETLKLNGSIPITSSPILTYQDTTLTSIVIVNAGSESLAFAGTSLGHVKKIRLSRRSSEELDDYIVDEGHTILSDSFADQNQENVYVTSAYRIVKVPVNQRRNQPHVLRVPVQRTEIRPPRVTQETIQYRPIQLPDIVVRPDIGFRQQPNPSMDVFHQPSTTAKQSDGGKKSMISGRRGVTFVNPPRDGSSGKTSGRSPNSSSDEISPVVLYLLPAAAGGVLVALVLVAVIGYRRKGSSHSTLSREGNHLIWTSTDMESKFPPPLIPSSSKPLSLISTPDRDSLFEMKRDRELSPTESDVNAIYSEISDFSSDRISSEDAALVAGINQYLLKQQADKQSPRIQQQHHPQQQQYQQVNQFAKESNHERESSQILIGKSSSQVTRIPAYPPFFTFNTVGSNRRNGNSFMQTHTQKHRKVHGMFDPHQNSYHYRY